VRLTPERSSAADRPGGRGPMAAALLALALLGGCASTGPGVARDPLEPLNRVVFAFNDQADELLVRPAASVYQAVVPEVLRIAVGNVVNNLLEPWTVVNQLLQAKPVEAAAGAARFVLNSTLGLAGVVDIATPIGLERSPEDLGQTLGRWGVPAGPYLVLPLLGPSSLRDAAGTAGAYRLDPVWHTADGDQRSAFTFFFVLETRVRLFGSERLIEGAALDRYSFIRDGYLQRRRNLVYDGNPPPLKEDDE
jgi:phospholipid-binding lipoprotein MlaA